MSRLTKELPKKIYMIKNGDFIYSVWSTKPTNKLKKVGGEIIEFELTESGDYKRVIDGK